MEVDMDTITAAGARLEQATGLPAILDAAYDAFEDMLSAIEAQQDPGSVAFTAFVMSGASAANGRDAIAAAPSLPAATHRVVTTGGTSATVTAAQAAAALTGLSRVLVSRLNVAADLAADVGDRAACAGAAHHAAAICSLLEGAREQP
jgi:hypothetical protein